MLTWRPREKDTGRHEQGGLSETPPSGKKGGDATFKFGSKTTQSFLAERGKKRRSEEDPSLTQVPREGCCERQPSNHGNKEYGGDKNPV